MIDYEKLKDQKFINIHSPKICDIIITESLKGSQNLVYINYTKFTDAEGNEKTQKTYVFKNSPEIFGIFRKYTEKVTEG